MNGGESADPRIAAFRTWVAEQSAVSGVHGVAPMVEGIAAGTSKKTWIFPGRMERGIAILRGADPSRLAEARPFRVVPPGDSPAIRALEAVGVALAGEPVVVVLGTGSVSYGAFHEALQLAAMHHAAATFVVTWYVGAGPFAAQLAASPAAIAASLGIANGVVDGTSAEAVGAAVAALAGGTGLLQVELWGKA